MSKQGRTVKTPRRIKRSQTYRVGSGELSGRAVQGSVADEGTDRAVISLNAGQAKIAETNGKVAGVDFVLRHDWPGGLDKLQWTETGDGWQRRSDPRYFPCCQRDHV